KFAEATKIGPWAVANFSARCDVRTLCRDLARVGETKGILLHFTIIYLIYDLIFVQGPWKKKNLADFGIFNQCLSPMRVNDQYLTNLLLKINAKLGGLNSILSAEPSQGLPVVSGNPTMIFGMDVSHGSPGHSDVPSIAAVVGSRQWPLVSRYRASVRSQSPKVEMIDSLFKPGPGDEDTGIVRELLLDFYASSGQRKPSQIVIFSMPVESSSVELFKTGKGKDDYLIGAASPPLKDDLSFRMWKTENNMVISWVINTMDTAIGQNILFYDTAYEIWMAAKETYSDNDNTAELFYIKGALNDLRKGEMFVTQYYNTLSRFWQHLDGFKSLDWECLADASRYKKIIEKERTFKFLLGLDKSLDEGGEFLEPSLFQPFVKSDIQPSDPNLIQGRNKELKVYSRRQKNPKPVEPHMHSEPCQTDVLSPTPTKQLDCVSAMLCLGMDGVSESQFNQVLNIELDQIIEACKFLDEKWSPKFTVIIAQKNHHTKFFKAGSPDNVPPGTVIDTQVCHPHNNDFYMCAHAGMIGTRRPTHYHVLFDDIGFTADDLQELIHSLSYVYQRSTTAISIVSLVRYAHLAATQVSMFVKFEEMSETSSSHGGLTSVGAPPVPELPRLHKNVCASMFFC
ncbi:hypothetical protein RJ639_026377, partial [Escallonia herrerae]